MTDYIFLMESRLSPEQWKVVLAVQNAAAKLSLNLYLVGGAIRDLSAGFPIDDLDFVTEGNPSKLLAELKRSGPEILSQDSSLQSAELRFPGGVLASVSMARSETYAKPAAKPKITAAPIVADLRRRDFAMNALGVSLTPTSRGLLIDPANGLADIEKREIRALSNSCFYEDPVRLFRAVRFRVRLGFAFHPKTATLFQAARADRMAEQASADGLLAEFRQVSRERQPVEILKAFDKEDLLRALSPRLRGTALDWNSMTRAYKASRALAHAGLHAPSFPLFLWLLSRKLPSRELTQLFRRLRLHRRDQLAVRKFPALSKRLAKDLAGKPANTPTRLYQLLSNASPDVLLLVMIDSSNAKVQSRIRTFLEKYLPLRSRLPEKELEALQVPRTSPRFQKILTAYFYAVIEGQVRNPAQQAKLLARLAQEIR